MQTLQASNKFDTTIASVIKERVNQEGKASGLGEAGRADDLTENRGVKTKTLNFLQGIKNFFSRKPAVQSSVTQTAAKINAAPESVKTEPKESRLHKFAETVDGMTEGLEMAAGVGQLGVGFTMLGMGEALSEIISQAEKTGEDISKTLEQTKKTIDDMSQGLEIGGAAVGIATASAALLATTVGLIGTISDAVQAKKDIEKINQGLQTQSQALRDAYKDKTFMLGKKQVSFDLLLNKAFKCESYTEKNLLFTAMKQGGVSPQDLHAINNLMTVSSNIQNINADLKHRGLRFASSVTSNVGRVATGVVDAVKGAGNIASLSAVSGVLGVVTSTLSLGVSAVPLERAIKSFARSTVNNVHYKDLMASNSVDHNQKEILADIRKDTHRIAQKKLVGKILNTSIAVFGVGMSVLGLVLATNPVTLFFGLGLLAVGIGIAVFSALQGRRHQAKVNADKIAIQTFQANARTGLQNLQREIAGKSLPEQAVICGMSNLKPEQVPGLLKLIQTPNLALLSTDERSSLSLLQRCYENGLRVNHEVMQKATSFVEYQKLVPSNNEPTTDPIGKKMQEFKAKEKSKTYTPEENEKLFQKAKKEVLAEFKKGAARLEHQSLQDVIKDLRGRDEKLIQPMFNKLYASLTTEKDKTALTEFYSDVSVSQGKEQVNEAMLASGTDQKHTALGRFLK